ncbi:MAG TPA: hypothetical protein VKB02_11075 [Pyrinomonadaceae bacterium]|nr:hypothetical protein [Pyrinomonadaceae bacterium]
MDSQISLQQPILDGGIRSINFFNGRLLSARDLTREQSANREADRRLGQAVGEGIAYGLEVSKASASTQESPVVTVDAGLAINRIGQTLMLPAKTDVALVRRATPGTGSTEPFGECAPLQSGTYVAGAGVYLLTIAPAQGTEGRAATHSLENAIAACNTDTTVTAVQFRLIQLDQQISAQEMLDQAKLRNLIAYKCFGVDSTSKFPIDPFTTNLEKYGLLDNLRPTWLTECEVPLAILYWTLVDGIKFIDLWSVRRRLGRRLADNAWSFLTSERTTREGEAMYLQFQSQLKDLTGSGVTLSQVRARDHFKYLPAAGFLPVGGAGGFDYTTFFNEITIRQPIFIEGAQLRSLFQESFEYPAVDTGSELVFYLYTVRENAQSSLAGAAPTQSYMVFASGHTLYRGEARYDVHHWNFGNFS